MNTLIKINNNTGMIVMMREFETGKTCRNAFKKEAGNLGYENIETEHNTVREKAVCGGEGYEYTLEMEIDILLTSKPYNK